MPRGSSPKPMAAPEIGTASAAGLAQKGRPRVDTPGAFYDLRLRLTASPSAASDQPHLLVTTTHLDHLLPLATPRPAAGTTRSRAGSSPSCHDRTSRWGMVTPGARRNQVGGAGFLQ